MALAEHFSGTRCGSACLIAREQVSEKSLFLREETQEQVPVYHGQCVTLMIMHAPPAPHFSVRNSFSARALLSMPYPWDKPCTTKRGSSDILWRCHDQLGTYFAPYG